MNDPLDMFIFAKVVELKGFSNAAKGEIARFLGTHLAA
jgi:hypothetical protein